MKLSNAQLRQLIVHARSDVPNETCGVIGGKDGRALKIYPLQNTHATPRVNYYADPMELLAAFRDMEANGWEHLAIYHSHLGTDAYPSKTDIAHAYYPDAIYLLISLANSAQALVRGFQIVESKVTEITVEVENETSRTHQRRVARRTSGPRAGRAVAALSRRRPSSGKIRRARRRVSKEI